MSSWLIHCNEGGHVTNPVTVDKLWSHTDKMIGWFHCSVCGSRAHIKKRFWLQEGVHWEPYILGMLNTRGIDAEGPHRTYFPFGFLVSDKPDDDLCSIWFCYYKVTHKNGGRLKMRLGHGAGGAPAYTIEELFHIYHHLGKIVRSRVDVIVEK